MNKCEDCKYMGYSTLHEVDMCFNRSLCLNNARFEAKQYTSYLEAVKVDKDLCLTIAMEECAELIQAISKAKRGKLDRDNLVEEMADICISMAWVSELFEIEDYEINKWIDYKTDRVVERLNKGEFK